MWEYTSTREIHKGKYSFKRGNISVCTYIDRDSSELQFHNSNFDISSPGLRYSHLWDNEALNALYVK